MYKNILKHFLDFVLSAVGLIVLSPVFLVVALLLVIQNRGNPFFVQHRPGKDLKGFYILKFKTMNDKRDANGNLLPDKDRLTWFGKIIRKTSLDEIPQLINVLKGDMSLIGPRPLLFKYIPLYSKEQNRRHEVRPGITGWAQVNGRNSIQWHKKFEKDVYYVDHISFLLDARILLLTFKKVLKSEGVNQTDSRPMEPFNGEN